jgi:hypothetical protein
VKRFREATQGLILIGVLASVFSLCGCAVVALPIGAALFGGVRADAADNEAPARWVETRSGREYECVAAPGPGEEYLPATCEESLRSWLAAVDGTEVQTQLEERSKARLACSAERVSVTRTGRAAWRLTGCEPSMECQATDRLAFACVALPMSADGAAAPGVLSLPPLVKAPSGPIRTPLGVTAPTDPP